MKRDIDFPKYINRFVGSVCILAAVALLIMAPIIQIDGVKSKDLRSVQTVVKEVIDAEEKWLLDVVPNSNAAPKPALGPTYTMPLETESMIVVSNIDLWYDLEDHDLPHTASEMKKWFAKIDNIADETLDKKVTLKEVFVLIWNVPGFAKDAKNLMETEYILDRAIDCMVNCDPDVFGPITLRANMEKAEEYFDEIRFYGYAAIGMIALLCLLAIYAVVGNLRNKGRGGKYVLLIITLAIAVGGYVGLPLLTEFLQASLQKVELLKNIELRLTIVPVLSSVLLIGSMMLDGWNRKRAKKASKKAEQEALAAAAESAEEVQPAEEIQPVAEAQPVAEEQPVVEVLTEKKEEPLEEAEEVAEIPEPVEVHETVAPKVQAEPAKKAVREIRITIPSFEAFGKIAGKILQKKKQIGIGVAVVAAVAVVVLSISMMGNTYKTPIRVMQKNANNKKFSFQYQMQLDQLNGLMKKETKEIIKILEDSDEFEDLVDELKENFEDNIDDLKDEYGSNYKYTYKIIDKEELEKKDLRTFRDALRDISDTCESLDEEMDDLDSDDWEEIADESGLSKSQMKSLVRELVDMGKVCKKAEVSAGYELTVEVTLTGSELDEPEESELTVRVYKVNGRWIAQNGVSILQAFFYVF